MAAFVTISRLAKRDGVCWAEQNRKICAGGFVLASGFTGGAEMEDFDGEKENYEKYIDCTGGDCGPMHLLLYHNSGNQYSLYGNLGGNAVTDRCSASGFCV